MYYYRGPGVVETGSESPGCGSDGLGNFVVGRVAAGQQLVADGQPVEKRLLSEPSSAVMRVVESAGMRRVGERPRAAVQTASVVARAGKLVWHCRPEGMRQELGRQRLYVAREQAGQVPSHCCDFELRNLSATHHHRHRHHVSRGVGRVLSAVCVAYLRICVF